MAGITGKEEYLSQILKQQLGRIFHESAYGGPQGVGPEAYLTGTSQGEFFLLRYAQDKFPYRRNTRGRQEGRPYQWSQSRQGVNS